MSLDWWGIPSNTESKYRSTGLSPSWAESPTPSNNTYTRKGSATDMYGTPQPVASEQSYRSTGVPSFLDPNYNGQTKKAFYAKIVKDASNSESSGNDDSSEHDGSSVEDVISSIEDVTSLVEDGTSSSSSKDGSEYESTREVVDSEANESLSESESSQVCVDEPSSDRYDSCVELNAKSSDLQSKYDDLQSKYDVTFIHNQSLIVDLSKCKKANMFYENHEKEFKTMIDNLRKDKPS
ncbi:hypothetical protein HanIR_Chr04g0161701 [Helianthus annuus]|uniref:uncharacterized protein LOC110933156 n=1 Tax=Helianthus annuus TaxID=4232 RepID=UPI000B8FCE0F|nr:uncharacterized protein LOC110933156 [Helianthus annuus]KAJ0587307.1 hypothetical protein HanIR_Chr04g0161701 [Helianthus annuus]